jgi:hypothetical protein
MTINELKNRIYCEWQVSEIGLLKVKVQNLEIKNRVLRTFSDLRCDIKMDLNKMFVGKKVYDKTDLGYAEMSSSSAPKKTGSPKENGDNLKNLLIKVITWKVQNTIKKIYLMLININIQIEDDPSPIDIDRIIVSKNISDESTIELLRNIALSKNKKLESKQLEAHQPL